MGCGMSVSGMPHCAAMRARSCGVMGAPDPRLAQEWAGGVRGPALVSPPHAPPPLRSDGPHPARATGQNRETGRARRLADWIVPPCAYAAANRHGRPLDGDGPRSGGLTSARDPKGSKFRARVRAKRSARRKAAKKRPRPKPRAVSGRMHGLPAVPGSGDCGAGSCEFYFPFAVIAFGDDAF